MTFRPILATVLCAALVSASAAQTRVAISAARGPVPELSALSSSVAPSLAVINAAPMTPALRFARVWSAEVQLERAPVAQLSEIAASFSTAQRDLSAVQAASAQAFDRQLPVLGEYDYVIVGGGTAGVPLAAELAKAGYSVHIIEAGGCEGAIEEQAPILHAQASEHPKLSWRYWARYFNDPIQKRRGRGAYYPRGTGIDLERGAASGSGRVNAMVTQMPDPSDYRRQKEATGDEGWSPERMEKLAQEIFNVEYRPLGKALDWLGKKLDIPSLQGRGGLGYNNPDAWVTLTRPNPLLIKGDLQLIKIALSAAFEALARTGPGEQLRRLWRGLDSNDRRLRERGSEGLSLPAMAIKNGERDGPVGYLRRVMQEHPGKASLRTNALATRVVLDENKRAGGVEVMLGAHLYRADRASADAPAQPERGVIKARREVILSAGIASAQLMMLSGIGDPGQIEKHGIKTRVPRPGVGKGVHDRIEVAVVSRLERPLRLLKFMSFLPRLSDRHFVEWLRERTGLFATNGMLVGFEAKSSSEQEDPDLYLFNLPARLYKYFPGYGRDVTARKDNYTWLALKGHTRSRAGRIELTSADPRDMPKVYTGDMDDPAFENDVEDLVEGILLARRMNARVKNRRELLPGPRYETREQLREYVRRRRFGHHIGGGNAMGAADDLYAVVDGQFRVIGVEGLRIVDASIFRDLPGLFPLAAVYLWAKKASLDILAAARAPSNGT